MGRRSQDNPIDWELIEKEYRLGQSTMRQLAVTHGVQTSAISRKIKRDGWVQDKSAIVKARSDAQLLSKAKATPSEVDIEAAATVRTDVILAHRGDARRARALTMSLLGELEHQTTNPEYYAQLQELLVDPVGEEDNAAAQERHRKRLKAFEGAMSLGHRTSTMKSLAESLAKVVAIEREAFGIASKGEEDAVAAQTQSMRDIGEIRELFKAKAGGQQ